jgi:hypothetical protein
VISTAQMSDPRWKYVRNAATRQDCWDAKEGFLALPPVKEPNE